jgi:hypothetical protein
MSRDRYKAVFQFTRFDNTETRQNHVSGTKDKLEVVLTSFLKLILKTRL